MVTTPVKEFQPDLIYDYEIDHAIVSLVILSKGDPKVGSDDHNEMIKLGKKILRDAKKTGELTISPFVKMFIGKSFPMSELRTALGKCGLMDPLE
jgi:hypothetical protein